MATLSPFDPTILAKLAAITETSTGVPVRNLTLESHGSGHRIAGQFQMKRSDETLLWPETYWLADGRHRNHPRLNLPFNLAEETNSATT